MHIVNILMSDKYSIEVPSTKDFALDEKKKLI